MLFTTKTFKDMYLDRINLDEQELGLNPTLEKLTKIQEAHLKHIPFENLSQHGCDRPATLDKVATAEKVLHAKRGGFCFELNGLLAELLEELGYQVARVPAIVYVPETHFNRPPAHLCLFLSLEDSRFFVDVAFGEPALHPLEFVIDREQTTVEGMTSRFVENEPGYVDLEYYNETKQEFQPRLRFQRDEIWSAGWDWKDFAPQLEMILNHEKSPFRQKVISCLVTRTHKYTVAGNQLKITSPRFGEESTKTVIELETDDDVRKALWEHFGIPNEKTIGLDLGTSLAANPEIWNNMG